MAKPTKRDYVLVQFGAEGRVQVCGRLVDRTRQQLLNREQKGRKPMLFEIKNRYTLSTIFSAEAKDKKEAVLTAIKAGADLRSANLIGANLSGASLSGADLSYADLSYASLSYASLIGANLRGTNLKSADLSGANLSGASLIGANLRGTNLRGTNLKSADLIGASLSGANLSGASLSGANLSGADLSYASLIGANLSGADLRSADLRSANLSGADLIGANLSDANLPSPTMVLLALWGTVSDTLCANLMVYDASCHPDQTAFDKWAAGGECPYADVGVQRACNFHENRTLWGKGELKNPYTLMLELFKEKGIKF